MKKALKFRTAANYTDVDLFVAPDPSTVPAYELSDLYKTVRRIRRPFGQFAQRTISFLEYILSSYRNAEVLSSPWRANGFWLRHDNKARVLRWLLQDL